MKYHYCIHYVGNNEIHYAYTPLENGVTTVTVEIPDKKFCFKTADCTIPGYNISNVCGMTQKDLNDFVLFCKENAALITRLARNGGKYA